MNNEKRKCYKEAKERYKKMRELEKKIGIHRVNLFLTLMEYRDLKNIQTRSFQKMSVKEWNKLEKNLRKHIVKFG